MSDHPHLRALAYGEDGSDPEDGDVLDTRGWGWAKSAWKKTKDFFKKVGDTLTKVWNKWKKKVSDWLAKGGKALACRVCVNPTRAPGMSWSDFKTAKSKIQSLACAKCRTG